MEVVPNIFIIKLPLPFKIDHVNCYLLRDKNGWSIIDTGLNYPPSTAVWEDTFAGLGIRYGDIKGIYVSHMHPCHYGAAGWLQELTGAPVFMNRAEITSVDQTWKKGRTNVPVVGELFKENGMPHGLISEVLENMTGVQSIIQPHPALSPLAEDGKVEMGGRWFEVINTPGHSEGHVIFFSADDGVLISGDHLLPSAASNVCLWPTSHSNPLELFLASLEKVGRLPVKLVLPAHGEAFTDCSGRIHDLTDYYHERLVQIAGLAGAGSTAYQICTRLFGADLTSFEIRFALTETLACLAYLEGKSMVVSRLVNGIVTYRKMERPR
ncbi:MAG: MBL fold metallo-hydrolase [Peptococcaceae bacterium]|nr:MBL fold metallo-hydrolase [Peptococcaceae bacterium]